MNPESPNQNHCSEVAAVGRGLPSRIQCVTLKRIAAMTRRVRFTTRAPIRLPAAVNAVEPIEKLNDVASAASSPRYAPKKISNFKNIRSSVQLECVRIIAAIYQILVYNFGYEKRSAF